MRGSLVFSLSCKESLAVNRWRTSGVEEENVDHVTKTRQISHTVGESDSSVSPYVIWQRKAQGWITTEKIRREKEGEP